MKPPVEHHVVHAGQTGAPQYLTGFDLRVGHPASPCLLVYPQGLDDRALAHSLGQLLRHYPVMAGRMKADPQGHVYIDVADDGVAFEVHRHAHAMPRWGVDRTLARDIGRYYRQVWPWQVVDQPKALLTIRVHHFGCGGSLLSVQGVHSLADGGAFWAFMFDWVRVHLGHPITPPSLDRQPLIDACEAQAHTPYTQGYLQALSAGRRTRLLARMAWQNATQVRALNLRFTAEHIAAWRDAARAELGDDALPSGHELVVAHCLRAWSARLPGPAARHLGQITDMRIRRLPGIPRKYIGNAVSHDLIALSPDTLAQPSLARVAQDIRMPLDRNSEADLLSYMGLMGRHRLSRDCPSVWVRGIVHSLDTGILLNNIAHFPMFKMDFGQGGPSWFDFLRTPYRMLVLTPAPDAAGGFVARLVARRRELADFPLLPGQQHSLA